MCEILGLANDVGKIEGMTTWEYSTSSSCPKMIFYRLVLVLIDSIYN